MLDTALHRLWRATSTYSCHIKQCQVGTTSKDSSDFFTSINFSFLLMLNTNNLLLTAQIELETLYFELSWLLINFIYQIFKQHSSKKIAMTQH